METPVTTSPEQLSIALMAEARSLFAIAERDAMTFPSDLQRVGDKLAMWATDAREIGVAHFRQKEQWRVEWLGTQAKLARVVQLCKDNPGNSTLSRAILEALND